MAGALTSEAETGVTNPISAIQSISLLNPLLIPYTGGCAYILIVLQVSERRKSRRVFSRIVTNIDARVNTISTPSNGDIVMYKVYRR
jgi:hypothetical protein